MSDDNLPLSCRYAFLAGMHSVYRDNWMYQAQQADTSSQLRGLCVKNARDANRRMIQNLQDARKWVQTPRREFQGDVA